MLFADTCAANHVPRPVEAQAARRHYGRGIKQSPGGLVEELNGLGPTAADEAISGRVINNRRAADIRPFNSADWPQSRFGRIESILLNLTSVARRHAERSTVGAPAGVTAAAGPGEQGRGNDRAGSQI